MYPKIYIFYASLFISLFSFNLSSAQVNQNDSLALVALYNSTDGQNWTDNSGWLIGPVSNWYGIAIDGDRVSEVELFLNNLNGTLPPEIIDLDSLLVLNFANNVSLGGEIPPGLESMAVLDILTLSSCSFSGSIPDSLGLSPSLTKIRMSRNQLSGQIPPSIGNIKTLEELSLNQNQFSGYIPDSLGSLSNLEILHLSLNQFDTMQINESLGNLSKLYTLGLQGCNLKGQIPVSLQNISDLRTIILGSNILDGSLEWISWFPKATNINVSSNRFTGALLPEWFNPNLQSCNISINNIDSLGDFTQFSKLTNFKVSKNNLEFEDLEKNRTKFKVKNDYEFQNLLLKKDTLNVIVGDSILLYSGSGGDYTQYKWFHDIIEIPDETESNLIIANVSIEDHGIYHCEMTNDSLPNLTLIRHNSFVNVGGKSLIEQDSLALVALYKATNGDQWKNNSNWLVDRAPEWFGVETKNGRVIRITLDNNNLTDTLPDDIGDLTKLEWLGLSNNSIEGEIPSSIGDLTSLVDLNIYNNKLTGEIPSTIGNCVELTSISLGLNNLTGNIPVELKNCTELINLHLWENDLSGEIPEEIGTLTKLQTLQIHSNDFTGKFPSSFSNFKELRRLGLSLSPGPTQPFPQWLGENEKLVEVSLTLSNLKGTIPENVKNLTSLSALRIAINQLSGELSDFLGFMPQLSTLEVWDNQFSGPIITDHFDLNVLIALNAELNQFDSLGDFSQANFRIFNIRNNNFNFDDLETNKKGLEEAFISNYKPQNKLGKPDTIRSQVGSKIEIMCDAGGIITKYKWYKDSIEILGELAKTLIIDSFTLDDLGKYHCVAVNDSFPDLVLQSHPTTLMEGVVSSIYSLSKNDKFSVYPNPTTNFFSIKLKKDLGKFNVSLFSPLGRVVAHKKSSDQIVDLELAGLPAGMYIIRIEHENNMYIGKVMKN